MHQDRYTDKTGSDSTGHWSLLHRYCARILQYLSITSMKEANRFFKLRSHLACCEYTSKPISNQINTMRRKEERNSLKELYARYSTVHWYSWDAHYDRLISYYLVNFAFNWLFVVATALVALALSRCRRGASNTAQNENDSQLVKKNNRMLHLC